MISAARDQVLALASVRHGLPAAYARGAHDLPADVLAPLEAALVGSLDTGELERAFHAVIDGLRDEIRRADGDLADRLAAPLAELAGLSRRPAYRRPSGTCPG